MYEDFFSTEGKGDLEPVGVTADNDGARIEGLRRRFMRVT
jgi:hypothetical protein